VGGDDLQALEAFVAENDDLLALEEMIGRFNIFDSLGIARTEIRHSNFLAWLLTPGESHGQGDAFIKPVLMDILRKARQQGTTPPTSPVELDGADLRGVDVRREWRNIDLLITCEQPSFVIAIENKIDSGEHGNQLQRYEETIALEFPDVPALHVFLTPEGDLASDSDWVRYSYGDLYLTLSRTRKVNSGAIGHDVAIFLDHYLRLIGDRFMDNADIDRLCKRIYSNHRRALDLIWQRAGSPESELAGRIQQWIEQRPESWLQITTKSKEVEFIPVAWNKMLPPIGKRKTFRPEHWLTMRLRETGSRLRLLVIVCPTTDAALRKKTLERLLLNKDEFGFSSFFKKKELTEEWTRVLSEDVCSLPEDEDYDADSILEKVERRLGTFLEQTVGLADAMKALLVAEAESP